MINLLPPELKESYRYAHRNVKLFRWVIAVALSLVGLVVISTAGLIYLRQNVSNYNSLIGQSEASLKEQKLEETQNEIEDMTGSLKLATQVLSKEVLFSKLLEQLATVTPQNAVLTDLSINQAQSAIDITALSTDYATATQLQVNLSDPANKIFSHADIVDISCTPAAPGTDPATAHYPCQVTLKAQFSSGNPFLFINDTGK